MSYTGPIQSHVQYSHFTLLHCHGDEVALADCKNHGLGTWLFRQQFDVYVSCQIGETIHSFIHSFINPASSDSNLANFTKSQTQLRDLLELDT